MSRKYILSAIINGNVKGFKKDFKSRDDAINYIYEYLNSRYIYNVQVTDEIYKSKHNVEYVLDGGDRFSIVRVD